MESVSLRSKQTDSGIDVSMNSPSELGLSFAGDRTSTDLGLLDLDSVLADDEESWLYGPSATASSSTSDTDLIAWLQNAAGSLEPKQRRALSQKLENIAKKKQVADQGVAVAAIDSTDTLIAEIDGLLGGSKPPPPPQRRDSAGSDDTEFYDAASDLDSTDPSLLVRTSTPNQGASEEAMKLAAQTRAASGYPTLPPKPKMVVLQSPTVELSTPDFVTAEEKMFGRGPPMATIPAIPTNASAVRPKSPAYNLDTLVPSAVKVHPELHPDLQDIQLLASLQEEDLRKALEKLQQQRQRKISQNSDHSSGGGAATINGRSPPAQQNHANMDRFDALAKQVSQQQARNVSGPSLSAASPAAARLAQQQPRRSLEARAGISVRTKSPRPINSFPSNLNGTSLQKSLPNLASSRSAEFANRQHTDTNSEQGSSNDITGRVSPAAGALAKRSGLRQPTPRRVSGGAAVRSGIPSPSPGRTAIPMPLSSSKRVGGVGNGRLSTGQPTPVRAGAGASVGGRGGAQPQHRQLDDSWKDDCF